MWLHRRNKHIATTVFNMRNELERKSSHKKVTSEETRHGGRGGRYTYTVVAVLRVAAGVGAVVFAPRFPNSPAVGVAVEPPVAVVAFGVEKPMVVPTMHHIMTLLAS